MFLRLRLSRHSAYDDTFLWPGESRDNEVQLYHHSTVTTFNLCHTLKNLNRFLNSVSLHAYATKYRQNLIETLTPPQSFIS